MADGTARLTLPEGSTAEDALKTLPLPMDEIGLIIIDGQSVKWDFALSNGDVLKVYPVIIGG